MLGLGDTHRQVGVCVCVVLLSKPGFKEEASILGGA